MSKTETEDRSYLSFQLMEEIYCVNVQQVLEILAWQHITFVPQAPEYMAGVLNLRGTVLPVISTRSKLGMPPLEPTEQTNIIVVKLEDNLVVGMIVDSAQEVFQLTEDEILPPPNLGNSYHSDFIIGLIERNQKFQMLIELDKVFRHEELSSLLTVSNENLEDSIPA